MFNFTRMETISIILLCSFVPLYANFLYLVCVFQASDRGPYCQIFPNFFG